jgi:uncharacterized BrkB/YihY/UPF0761 family membrane protein
MDRFYSIIGLGLSASVAAPSAAFAFANPSAIGVPELNTVGLIPVVALVACLAAILYYRARAKRSQ